MLVGVADINSKLSLRNLRSKPNHSLWTDLIILLETFSRQKKILVCLQFKAIHSDLPWNKQLSVSMTSAAATQTSFYISERRVIHFDFPTLCKYLRHCLAFWSNANYHKFCKPDSGNCIYSPNTFHVLEADLGDFRNLWNQKYSQLFLRVQSFSLKPVFHLIYYCSFAFSFVRVSLDLFIYVIDLRTDACVSACVKF